MKTGLWTMVLLAAGLLPATAIAEVRYFHTDALGSVVAVTDENGNVIERREYEPYGKQLTPAVQDGPGYTGHVQDAATGLTYMQQRYYDPSIGMFLSGDPVTTDSDPVGQFHRYRYANNNPYKFTDPDGRQALNDPCNGCVLVTNPTNPAEKMYVPEVKAHEAYMVMATNESSFQDYNTLDKSEAVELLGTGSTVAGGLALAAPVTAPITGPIALITGGTAAALDPSGENILSVAIDVVAKPVGMLDEYAGKVLSAISIGVGNKPESPAPNAQESSEPKQPGEPYTEEVD